MLLKGKVAIITGAGSGIGRAAAVLFAHEGAQLLLLDKDANAGHETLAMLNATDSAAAFLQTDMTQADQVKNAVASAIDRFARLDVMFNVVGASGRRYGDGPIADCTEEGWDWVMAVNLKSMFLGSKFAVQQMLKQGSGSVINTSSVLGLVGGDADFGTHAYAASKAGIIGMTRAMASYYAKEGIRANVICPGLIATNMSKRAQSNEHIIERLKDLQPLTSDFGQPSDVAGAALYLASDHAKFVTGAILTVDGGWTTH